MKHAAGRAGYSSLEGYVLVSMMQLTRVHGRADWNSHASTVYPIRWAPRRRRQQQQSEVFCLLAVTSVQQASPSHHAPERTPSPSSGTPCHDLPACLHLHLPSHDSLGFFLVRPLPRSCSCSEARTSLGHSTRVVTTVLHTRRRREGISRDSYRLTTVWRAANATCRWTPRSSSAAASSASSSAASASASAYVSRPFRFELFIAMH